MFDHETYRNIAVVVDWARRRLSVKALTAFTTAGKDVLAVIAAGITSGLPMKQWDGDPKITALLDKMEVSIDNFQNVFEEEVIDSDLPL